MGLYQVLSRIPLSHSKHNGPSMSPAGTSTASTTYDASLKHRLFYLQTMINQLVKATPALSMLAFVP